MAEQKPNEEKPESKVVLEKEAVAEEKEQAVEKAVEQAVEQKVEVEEKPVSGSASQDHLDQSKHNLPIHQEKVDMLEQLENAIKKIGLNGEEKEILRKGLAEGKFSNHAKEVCNMLRYRGKYDAATTVEDMGPLYDPHDFWDNQPVPRLGEQVDPSKLDQPIEVKSLEEVRKEPLGLPANYHWANLNLNDDKEAKELYNLLTRNYVEDDDAMFRFDYSVPFLRWALLPPGQHADWLVGVRGGPKNALYGFISGIPVEVSCKGKLVKMAEINFLCVHKALRANRLAPILIREITRRVNALNIWQAVYTAGVTIPTPIANATYWHRSLNPKKLVEVRFSSLPANKSMAHYLKMHRLPSEPQIPGMRPMAQKDVPRVHKLLIQYGAKFKLHMHFSPQEVAYFFLPREGVIYSYVVEDEKDITDFVSFYSLPSSILKHPEHKTLNAAYSYYNVTTTNRLEELMKDALVRARDAGFDVFNCLDLMENRPCLENLKFGVGDGHLHYYLYNWRIPFLEPKDVGIVLV